MLLFLIFRCCVAPSLGRFQQHRLSYVSACGLWLTSIQAAGVFCMKLRFGNNQTASLLLLLAGWPTFFPRHQRCSRVLEMSCHCGVFCFLLCLPLRRDAVNRRTTGRRHVFACLVLGSKHFSFLFVRSGAIKWAKFRKYLQILRLWSPLKSRRG